MRDSRATSLAVVSILSVLAALLHTARVAGATPAAAALQQTVSTCTCSTTDARTVVPAPASTQIKSDPAPAEFAILTAGPVTNDFEEARPAQRTSHASSTAPRARLSRVRGDILTYRFATQRPPRLYLTVSSRLRE